jgi:tRNA-splicing ligase RtcB
MSETTLAPLSAWLVEPMEPAVAAAIERLRRAPDVRRVAVMPDVHLASEVCVGTVLATSQLVYPQAVGGDIGCGMLAVAFDVGAEALGDPAVAGRVLGRLGEVVPVLRRHRRHAVAWPEGLAQDARPRGTRLNGGETLRLSHPGLEGVRREVGALQLGTLGSGNHFVELQGDEDGRLWLMIHSGSRGMGQAIRDHHLARAVAVGWGLKALDVGTEEGAAYVRDVGWARAYAEANRRAMAERVADVLAEAVSARPAWETLVSVDHNHVVSEEHGGERLWVHRKGAMPAGMGVAGVLPGSMGTESFHVEGRGCDAAMWSSAHGAGRAMSRESARKGISERDLRRQMGGVWYDYRHGRHLREEAPTAYKDVRAVMRAQRELVKVVRVMRPVLNYKGR